MAFASQQVPYYRQLGLKPIASLAEFSAWPVMNKSLLIENLGLCNSQGLQKQQILDFVTENETQRNFSRRLRGISIGMSSGTSGNKGIEMVSAEEEAALRAIFFARFPYDFIWGERIKMAFILRVSSPAFRLDFLGHKLFYVNPLQPLAEVVGQLNSIQPNILSAPPSYLALLAGEQKAGRLAIQSKMILSYAEVLDALTRRNISQVFPGQLMEIYKATEGAIGMPCAHGSLHVNEDVVYLETLNEDYSPCPPGQACTRLLVTDLIKRTLPVIRFELNDIITLSPQSCACGSAFRVIEQIQGRRDALLIGQTAGGQTEYIMPDFIARLLITISDDIIEYQVRQLSPGQLQIFIQPAPGADQEALAANIRAGVSGVFERFNCLAPHVSVVFGPLAITSRSGKLIRISREF